MPRPPFPPSNPIKRGDAGGGERPGVGGTWPGAKVSQSRSDTKTPNKLMWHSKTTPTSGTRGNVCFRRSRAETRIDALVETKLSLDPGEGSSNLIIPVPFVTCCVHLQSSSAEKPTWKVWWSTMFLRLHGKQRSAEEQETPGTSCITLKKRKKMKNKLSICCAYFRTARHQTQASCRALGKPLLDLRKADFG